jgi:hypothetical protein
MLSASVRLLSEQKVLDAFELAIFCEVLKPPPASPGSLVIPNNLIVGMSSTKSLADPSVRSLWGPDARFRAYANLDFNHDASRDANSDAYSLFSTLTSQPELLNDPSWRKRALMGIVETIQRYSIFARGQEIAEVLSIPIDSLMTVEIRNWGRRFLNMELSLVAINKAGTIEGLGELVIESMRSKQVKK